MISDATLNRFFAFHVIALPLVLCGLVAAHVLALHEVGSNNPDGIEIKKGPKGNRWSPDAPADGFPFRPYYSVKDIAGVVGFFILFLAVVFFLPDFFGYFLERRNFEPANPLKTPVHIAPVWYFKPFYAMLRAVPSFAGTQVWGVLVMERRAGDPVLPALAGPQPGQVDPLQGPDLQGGDRSSCCQDA